MKKLLFGICLVFALSGSALADDAGIAEVETLAKTSASWDGKSLPCYAKGQPEITILKITIPPKARLPLHKHPVINAGFMLSGELTVTKQGGKVLRLKAGDPIVEVVDTWHYGRNEGDIPAEIVVFYAGAVDTPITINR